MQKLLTRRDLCEMLQISYPTLCRWLNANMIPQPLNGRRKKLLWCPTTIEQWIRERQQPVATAHVTSPAQQRQQAKAHEQRQEAAHATLAKHGIDRKSPPN